MESSVTASRELDLAIELLSNLDFGNSRIASLSTLPPEILELILDQVELADDFTKVDLMAISQVERNLYLPAKTRIMRVVNLDADSNCNFHKYLKLYPFSASMINELTIQCLEIDSSYEIGTEEIEETHYQELELGTFKTIIELLPSLRKLRLSNFENIIWQISSLNKLPIFPSLVSLYLNSETQLREKELDAVINPTTTPNLEELHLSITPTGYGLDNLANFTLSIFPTRRLNIFGRFESGVAIPALFLLSLEELHFECILSSGTVITFVKLNNGTLQVLHLESSRSGPYKFNRIGILFPKLTVLTTLSIRRFEGLPVDFLQHLPPTLTTLEIPTLELVQLEHFRNNPRPSLRLKYLTLFDAIENSIFQSLPHSLVEITLEDTRGLSLEIILENLRKSEVTLLSKINYTVRLYQGIYVKSNRGTVEHVRELGIVFKEKFSDWYDEEEEED